MLLTAFIPWFGTTRHLSDKQDLPHNDYYDYFGPEYKLDVPLSNIDNFNTPEYLDKIKARVFDNLRNLQHAPSVQMQPVPYDPDREDPVKAAQDAQDPDVRVSEALGDALTVGATGEALADTTVNGERVTGRSYEQDHAPVHDEAGRRESVDAMQVD